jgi:hypothetical protein
VWPAIGTKMHGVGSGKTNHLRLQLPDLRLAFGTVLLIVRMAVGWVRSTRRRAATASSAGRAGLSTPDSASSPTRSKTT